MLLSIAYYAELWKITGRLRIKTITARSSMDNTWQRFYFWVRNYVPDEKEIQEQNKRSWMTPLSLTMSQLVSWH